MLAGTSRHGRRASCAWAGPVALDDQHVMGDAKPRGIVFVPEVRRSPSGKADLLWARAVAEAAAAAAAGQQTR